MGERKSISPLARLLKLRRHEEECRTLDLVNARKAEAEADGTVRDLKDRKSEIERSLGASEGGSVGRVQSMRVVLDRVEQGIHNAETVRQAAATEAEERRAEFHGAARAREAIERVMEHRQAEALRLDRSAEQKKLDEVALSQFLTKPERSEP